MKKISVYFDNVKDYKRICDKLHDMGYEWASQNKLTDYLYLDEASDGRTMYSNIFGTTIWRVEGEKKGSIRAKQFLPTYDL